MEDKLIETKNESNEQASNDVKFDSLNERNIWAYGVGHFMNDLCAACWFNFLSIYLKNINPISIDNPGYAAGIVLLSGQIFDGVATPLVGYFSDKTKTRIGKRMPWYLFGVFTVMICFIFIFQDCFLCSATPSLGFKIFYYAFFASVFNIGWASLQISHMSLVPQITVSVYRRDRLNSLRNTFTYIANFSVLAISTVLFATIKDSKTDFSVLSFIVIGSGLVACLFFILSTKEPKITSDCEKYTQDISKMIIKAMKSEKARNRSISIEEIQQGQQQKQRRQSSDMKQSQLLAKMNSGGLSVLSSQKKADQQTVRWVDWFKKIEFYQYGLCYMGVRILTNVIMTVLTFYTRYTLVVTEQDIQKSIPFQLALLPLIMYIFSVMGSSSINYIVNKSSRKVGYSVGAVLVVSTSIGMFFLTPDNYQIIYPLIAISGFGQAICLNSGINMISEVIGIKGQSGAFVFGMYSLLDKFSNGILLFLLLQNQKFEQNDPEFIRYSMVFIPIAGCVLSWLMIALGKTENKQGYVQMPSGQIDSKDVDDLKYKNIIQEFAGEINE